MAVFKLGFILTVLLMTTTMDVLWYSKTNVLAWNVEHDFSRVERCLLPQLNDALTCGKDCQTNDDCSDCWVCCKCDVLSRCDVVTG
ncbi:hypothetical protein A4A49_58709 [Nicotiana attenuata]|uniref:Carboxypeptidase A inhibitor-like domain-containing protein n=1 Tax=Nicotiana attenuata TaxID=49451 RepID=A0A1J6HU81_NICAT|nr:hypothetical protein A4A49_58709 [Nicotiana attenuata]